MSDEWPRGWLKDVLTEAAACVENWSDGMKRVNKLARDDHQKDEFGAGE